MELQYSTSVPDSTMVVGKALPQANRSFSPESDRPLYLTRTVEPGTRIAKLFHCMIELKSQSLKLFAANIKLATQTFQLFAGNVELGTGNF